MYPGGQEDGLEHLRLFIFSTYYSSVVFMWWCKKMLRPNTGSVVVHCGSPRAKVLYVWMWHQLEKGTDQSGHRLPFALYQNPQLTWGQPTHQQRTLQRIDGSAGGCRNKKTPQDLALCPYFHLRGPGTWFCISNCEQQEVPATGTCEKNAMYCKCSSVIGGYS